MVVVATWNTRGCPLNDRVKKKALDNYLRDYDYVLLQECGALATHNAYNGSSIFGSGHLGGMNQRCSTAILCPKQPIYAKTIYLQSGTGRSAVVVVDPRKIVIAAFHAEASPSGGGDGLGLLGTLDNDDDFREYKYFIVGGDWNCDPPRSPFTTGTGDRPGRSWWSVAKSGQPTHEVGELDYFLFANFKTGSARREDQTFNSDHYPVIGSFF